MADYSVKFGAQERKLPFVAVASAQFSSELLGFTLAILTVHFGAINGVHLQYRAFRAL